MDEIQAYELQIEGFLNTGRLDDARKVLARAYREFPGDTQLKYLEAKIEGESSNWEPACLLIQEALQCDPENPNYRFYYCQALSELGNNPDAEKVIIDLIQEYPDDADYYAFYAVILLESNQLKKAFALSQAALQLDPNSYYARFVAAWQQSIVGKTANADLLLRALIAENPESVEICRVMIFNLNQQGKYELALRLSQSVLLQAPTDEWLIQTICELKALTHPLNRPFRFLFRYNFLATIATWFFAVIIIKGLQVLHFTLAAVIFGLCYLTWAILSWIIPPMLRRKFRYT